MGGHEAVQVDAPEPERPADADVGELPLLGEQPDMALGELEVGGRFTGPEVGPVSRLGFGQDDGALGHETLRGSEQEGSPARREEPFPHGRNGVSQRLALPCHRPASKATFRLFRAAPSWWARAGPVPLVLRGRSAVASLRGAVGPARPTRSSRLRSSRHQKHAEHSRRWSRRAMPRDSSGVLGTIHARARQTERYARTALNTSAQVTSTYRVQDTHGTTTCIF